MKLKLQSMFLSIKALDAQPLPPFAVLTGRNGVGKTQLLEAIQKGSVSSLKDRTVERYDTHSFRPPSSETASWSGSIAASSAAQLYFQGTGPQPPAETASKIYEEAVESFGLAVDDQSSRAFATHLKTAMDKTQVRILTSPLRGVSGDPQIDDAIEFYTSALADRVISRLRQHPTKKGQQPDNRSQVIVTLAVRLACKLAHELNQADFLRAAHHEGKTIANTVSEAFARYKVDQYSWAHSQSEVPGRGDAASLLRAYRENHKPPWETLREILSHMREEVGEELFNFEFTDPEDDRLTHATHQQYSFRTVMTNRTTGDTYDLHTLSSGESILMCLCLIWFDQELGRKRPDLLLLDELDALLHPSMVSALIACLRRLFVANGTRVLMATHCASTVAALNNDEIFATRGRRPSRRPTLNLSEILTADASS